MDLPRPPAVERAVGDHRWLEHPADNRVELATRWPGQAWLVGPHLVRCGPAETVEAEVQRHRWLAERIATAELAMVDDTWLIVTDVGHRATQPELQPAPDDVPSAIGAALRDLHEVDTAGCLFDAGWSSQIARIGKAIEAGHLDEELLPDPYSRYQPNRLLEMLVDSEPAEVDPVVCHGTPVVSNLFLRDGELRAATGLHGLGVGDAHLDLAVCHRSLLTLFGPEALVGFYQGYGAEADLVRLDHYVLIDVLLGALRPQPSPQPSPELSVEPDGR